MGIIDRYRQYLPVGDDTPVVTLEEGATPLIPAYGLSRKMGKGYRVWLKYEGLNPTASFKDRGMTLAVSKAKESGAEAVSCASTGNTSASAAAYAARGNMKCIVVIPEGAIALGKLAQALVHGATVIAVRGNFDQALEIVRRLCKEYPVTIVNSVNPYRIEGQKTGSFEICDVLGRAPFCHALPVGNAGNITSYWKGYRDYLEAGKIDSLPRMLGFQAAGAAPIVEDRVFENPETIATAIRIGDPASWEQAVEARDASGGLIDKVTDDEILRAYHLLAREEGVFAEPASAASVAGILKKYEEGYFQEPPEGEVRDIVCVLTGHGLKDPDRAIKTVEAPVVVDPVLEEVAKKAGLS